MTRGFPSDSLQLNGVPVNKGTLLIALPSVALFASLASAQTTSPKAPTSLATDAEIRKILVDRIDVQHKSVGTVVGIISPEGRRIISYGKMDPGDSRPLNSDTVFEIGSVTKIFTALLLADMVKRGEVALTDPVAKYLPSGVKVPERNGRQITLVDLATHTSGLPFFPSDIPLKDPAEVGRILANYPVLRLFRFLSTYDLPRDIGSKWEYSNVGVGLLGLALANRAGMDYEALVYSRITRPLGMESTAITISPQMKARLGVGHDNKSHATPDVDMPAFMAAASFRSTANDLLTFLGAFMGFTKSPLARAMAAMLETRRPGPGWPQTLGWWIVLSGQGDDGIVAFGGQTLGYASTVAYDPKMRVGVVVLSNQAEDDGGLGWHLLRPAFPVKTSETGKERKEVTLDPKLYDLYPGQYQPDTGAAITVERRGDALFVKFETAPQGLRLHAENEREFFIVEADVQITFKLDDQGHPNSLVVHFAGKDYPAPRVSKAKG
jgi:D-alanyl-D-alanine-carboxypeptidase/D-alanyl-D-alanine-endopeptidase